WDGTAWSDHRRASTVPVAPVAPAPIAPEAPAAADDAPAVPAPAAFAAPGAVATPTPAAPAYPAAPASPAGPGYPAAPAYGAPGYPVGYGAPAYAPAQPTNSLAIVGFVIALAGILVSFVGLTSLTGAIISTIALVRANRMRAQGIPGDRWGLALAGVIAGFAIFVVVAAVTVAFFAFAISSAATSSDPTTFG
ncbi:hypothetical protein, partial [Mesorhizobium japonicum]|uniref:hypothetical protein n=1 Tax=Mesorhizobium japonicum TaxID=2066070 RepID=UPI003B592EFA